MFYHDCACSPVHATAAWHLTPYRLCIVHGIYRYSTVCDVKNVVTLRPFTSRDHNTLWDRNPSCLSVCLPDSQGGWAAVSSGRRVIDAAPLSLSPSFIHSHVSHHRGFRRKRDNAVRVCVRVYVAASGDSLYLSLSSSSVPW